VTAPRDLFDLPPAQLTNVFDALFGEPAPQPDAPRPTHSEDRAAMAGSVHDSLAYIREHYNVPAHLGGRVRYTWRGDRLGTIVGTSGARLLVRLDGDRDWAPYHPTWEIEYLTDAEAVAR
jgi:hypothetical protein